MVLAFVLVMNAHGRPKAPLVLTSEERETLLRWSRRPKSAQALAMRCRIVLACAEGATNKAVAAAVGVSANTVSKWRRRFVEERLEGLFDEPRPGAPRKTSDEQVERVVVKTLEEKPRDATHWSSRGMAKAVGLSQTKIVEIWQAFGLQPWRQDTFKLSTDPQFVDKVRDVVGLYLDPPERAVVLCVDEKSQIQALERSTPILAMMPGVPERASHDYKRNGTTSLFAALDLTTGKVLGSLHRRHRAVEFLKFLKLIDANVPDRLDIHLVFDSYATQRLRDEHQEREQEPDLRPRTVELYESELRPGPTGPATPRCRSATGCCTSS
ncbi:MAG: IS630 family transposase [Actinobacteria bacterium]|nr:IS630 family transposase [Actinomycetota bacterium]